MNILGISAYYHDSAACLVQDGRIIAAAQEERFTRVKHDSGWPALAIKYCLEAGNISSTDLDILAFYDKPFLKFERLLSTYLHFAPRGLKSYLAAMPIWITQKVWIKDTIAKKLNFNGTILFPEHHASHAASAFFPSPFGRAAFLTVDGVGEWTTTSYGVGRNNQIKIHADINFPHSLGLLYSAVTYHLGFKVNSAEYKVMGLAPYGEPAYAATIKKNLINIKDDGSFRLDLSYFNYAVGLTMTNDKFSRLFKLKVRTEDEPLTEQHLNLARSIQAVTEDVMVKMARHVQQETGEKNLCLAGGVALNCVANSKILEESGFDDIWIQPAAGDAGGALGAALIAWHQHLSKPRVPHRPDAQTGSLLGPQYSDNDIENFLSAHKIPHRFLSTADLTKTAAILLAKENVIGWFQGRMEYGPRALGNRSILGDARSAAMQKTLNLKIKFRESFRPFAPAVLAEKVSEWFDLDRLAPYMLLVAPVRANHRRTAVKSSGLAQLKEVRSDIPAVTHVDYSARVQTVDKNINPLFHQLIGDFESLTGCPVIINTSFHVRGEPIVCSPADAFRCFLRTDMDYLVLGHFLLDKKEQSAELISKARQEKFAPD